MRVQSRNLYQLDELSDKAKAVARDWWRYGRANDYDNVWADAVIDDACTVAPMLGIAMEKANITWALDVQGAGASFTGTWDGSKVNIAALTDYCGGDDAETLSAIANTLSQYATLTANITPQGNTRGYCHEYTVYIEVHDVAGDEVDADSRAYIDVRDALHNFMRWIHTKLDQEWAYQNSDEGVDAAINANEYEFIEDGRRAQ